MEIEKEIKELRVRVAACENIRPVPRSPGMAWDAPSALEEIANRHWTGRLWIACTEDILDTDNLVVVVAATITGAGIVGSMLGLAMFIITGL